MQMLLWSSYERVAKQYDLSVTYQLLDERERGSAIKFKIIMSFIGKALVTIS